MSALLITGLRLLYKEYVLTPRGRDMNPELGPVVAPSLENSQSYISGCGNMIFFIGRSLVYFLFPYEFRWLEAGPRKVGDRRFKNHKTGLRLVAGEERLNLRRFISGQLIVSGFDGWGGGTINKIFMECEVCDKPSKRRAKVFIKGDELYLCMNCVLLLQRKRLEYCEERQRYLFIGYLRESGRLRGRIWGVFGFWMVRCVRDFRGLGQWPPFPASRNKKAIIVFDEPIDKCFRKHIIGS